MCALYIKYFVRYPFLASEIFTSELTVIMEKFFEEPEPEQKKLDALEPTRVDTEEGDDSSDKYGLWVDKDSEDSTKVEGALVEGEEKEDKDAAPLTEKDLEETKSAEPSTEEVEPKKEEETKDEAEDKPEEKTEDKPAEPEAKEEDKKEEKEDPEKKEEEKAQEP